MSHIVKVDVVYLDQKTLIDLLNDKGIQHTKKEDGMIDISVSLVAKAYDFTHGYLFHKNATVGQDGVLHVDDMDYRQDNVQSAFGMLSRDYATRICVNDLRTQGYHVEQELDQDGNMLITATSLQ